MPDQAIARRLTHTELRVWRSFLRAHATVIRVLETELEADQRLSMAAYDVLVQLAEAPERRLRMTELAEAVLLSRSGVTRLVDRLERVGLVTRERIDSDGRGVVAVLTQAGVDRLRTASAPHLAGVLAHFVEVLGQDALAEFGRSCERLAGGPESELPDQACGVDQLPAEDGDLEPPGSARDVAVLPDQACGTDVSEQVSGG